MKLPNNSLKPIHSSGSDRVVYTCVMGGYDVVFPPIKRTPNTDYVLFTDNRDYIINGWQTVFIEKSADLPSNLQNRHCKIFPEAYFSGYTASMYLDGNIRILGDLDRLFRILERSYDIVLLEHPRRFSVSEEVEACVRMKKAYSESLKSEFEEIMRQGFVENGYLTENNVIVRRHNVEQTSLAMAEWWEFVQRFSGRDQISLLHCLQKFNCRAMILPFCSRDPNPFLYKYGHFNIKSGWLDRMIVISGARRGENQIFKLIYGVLVSIQRSKRRVGKKIRKVRAIIK